MRGAAGGLLVVRAALRQKVAQAAVEACPICTAELIVRHLLIAEPLNAEGLRLAWEKRGSRGKILVVDLGVMSIERQIGPAYRLAITVLGEKVLVATTKETEIFTPGAWQDALEAVAVMLGARYGPLIDARDLN